MTLHNGTLRIGTLGAARISDKALYTPAHDNDRARVTAIAARSRSRAEEHAREWNIGTVHETYADLLADPDIDAVYNPLPITLHHTYTIAALEAGKHVLSEKPFAANAALARSIVDAAERTGLVCMEAFHWRYHPMAARIREIIDSGLLGEIRSVEAVFDVYIRPEDDVRQSYELGGGALMDLGCYPVQWARWVMPGYEPRVLEASMVQGRPDVDVDTVIKAEYPNGVPATLSTKMTEGTDFRAELRVTGSDHSLLAVNPLAPHEGNRVVVEGAGIDEVVHGQTTYHHQLDAFIDAIGNGAPIPTGGRDAIANMEFIDAAYLAAGLPVRTT
ncbi:MAG: Gfo/Idh/MocA family oxidoreductase [Acidimicrobiales bacterium]|nr:Gfo/Idh/MocA family oxidoreductase [Acidimicrobiales bacterium]